MNIFCTIGLHNHKYVKSIFNNDYYECKCGHRTFEIGKYFTLHKSLSLDHEWLNGANREPIDASPAAPIKKESTKRKTLFVVFQIRDIKTNTFEFQGVFDTKEKAIQACVAVDFFWYSVKVNESFPTDTVPADAEHPFWKNREYGYPNGVSSQPLPEGFTGDYSHCYP